MNSENGSMSAPVHAIVSWLESAPDVAKEWLRNDITTLNWLAEERNRAFQMIGQYDGAMSEECKQSFRDKYELLTRIYDWCQSS